MQRYKMNNHDHYCCYNYNMKTTADYIATIVTSTSIRELTTKQVVISNIALASH